MISVLLFGIALVTLVWELYYQHNWNRQVTVTLWFETDALYAGETTKLYEVIENRKSMPVPVFEVGFHTQKELDFAGIENTSVSDYIYKRDVFSVLGRQKITREIPLTCTKRGRYIVKEADITTYSLFFKKRFSKGLECNASIYVYPKMTDVSQIMTICEHMLGTLQCAKRLYEDPFTFRTIRGYTVQDPMKTINWKASAKTGSLMVNTFDSVMSQKAMIFLDVEDNGILKRGELVEESIAVAATLMRRLLRQGIEVGLCMNGTVEGFETYIPPTNQKGKLILVERMLAEFQPERKAGNRRDDSTFPYGELLETVWQKYCPSEDTLLVFITKNLDEPLQDKIKCYAGDKQALIVYPIRRGEEQDCGGVSMKGKENVRILVRELG